MFWHEKRVNRVLLSYWETLRVDGHIPKEASFKPNDIQDIWDNCFFMEARNFHDNRHYKYSYIGKALVEDFGGKDATAKQVYDYLTCPSKGEIVPRINKIMETGHPIIEDSEYVDENGLIIKYRQSIAPLTGVSGEVEYIVGAMRWVVC